MAWRLIWTTFFLLMALTTTVSFLFHGNGYELIIAVCMNLIATMLKLGTRHAIGSMMMSASLVSDFHLIPALGAFYVAGNLEMTKAMVWGALVANAISVLFLVIEAVLQQLDNDSRM
ncbi:DUF6394 family protein [Magnetofaba australis]|uniref:Putative MacA n=1 Tax=Magnetofaba australis IT-1 TaxID=1434232 RepID=A0A1Y2K3J9_9PROT|nr:DUF6394 family protein [Magnetofaba australis]OSM02583.1 putative MacA [Magnetofaba australis IT-1]